MISVYLVNIDSFYFKFIVCMDDIIIYFDIKVKVNCFVWNLVCILRLNKCFLSDKIIVV